MSIGTATAEQQVALLRKELDESDLAAADDVARRIIDTCDKDADGAVELRGEGLFEALCIRLSLAAVDGERMSALRKETRKFKQCPLTNDQNALASYVEGTCQLRESPQIARRCFLAALDQDPHFVVAELGLGAVCLAEGDFRGSFSAYKSALRKLGDLAPNIVRVVMGVCSFKLREFEHATKCIDRALEVDPKDAMALLMRFMMQIHFRQAVDAVATIKRLVHIAPSTVVVQRYLDITFFSSIAGDHIQSHGDEILRRIVATGEAAAKAKRTALVAYADMQAGRVHQALGRYPEALECYDRAVAAAPDLRAAVVHRAEVLNRIGHKNAAEAVTSAMDRFAKVKDPRLLQMAAELYSASGDHSRAVNLGRMLVESVAKEQPEAWALAAWVNRLDESEMQRLTKVTRELRRTLGRPDELSLRANAAAIAKDKSELATVAQLVLGFDLKNTDLTDVPRVGPREFPFVFNYALLCEKDEAKKARSLYIRLVRDAPSESAPYERLVQLASAAGRPAEALRWARLLQAATASTEDETGTVLQAWVLKSEGRLRQSLELVRTAAQKRKAEDLAMCTGSLYLADVAQSSEPKRKLEQALNGFNYALKRDPHNVLAAHGAACCVAGQGYHGNASVLLERVAEIDCNVASVKENVREHRFNVLLETRAYRNAISAFAGKQGLTKWQRCALAVCHVCIEEHDKAIDTLEVALEEHPKDASVCFYMTFVLLSAVFSAITGAKPLASDDGEEAQARLLRATELYKYAVGVKSDDQRRKLRRIMSFVNRGLVKRALERRMADYRRERADAVKRAEDWRATAAEVRRSKEEQSARDAAEQAELLRQRTEASQDALRNQQRILLERGIVPPGMTEEGLAQLRDAMGGSSFAAQGAGAEAYPDMVYDPAATTDNVYGEADDVYGAAPTNGHKREREEDATYAGDLAHAMGAIAGDVEMPDPLEAIHAAVAEDFAADPRGAIDPTMPVNDGESLLPADDGAVTQDPLHEGDDAAQPAP